MSRLWLLALSGRGRQTLADEAAGLSWYYPDAPPTLYVVRAVDEESARRIAAANCEYEDERYWLDPALSDCTQLEADGPDGCIRGTGSLMAD